MPQRRKNCKIDQLLMRMIYAPRHIISRGVMLRLDIPFFEISKNVPNASEFRPTEAQAPPSEGEATFQEAAHAAL